MKKRIVIGGAVVLVTGGVIIALMAALIVMPSPIRESAKASRALDLARLADAPAAARNTKADGTETLFSMSYYYRFEASATDIAHWVSASPGLQGISADEFDADRRYLPQGSDSRIGVDELFWPPRDYPWWNPEIRVRGRRFIIPQDGAACWGEVIINDETGTVFVHGNRS